MIFTSKYRKLSMVLKPARYVVDNTGQRSYVAGIRADFFDGRFATQDQEVIEMMMNHPRLGIDYHAETKPVDKAVVEAEKQKEAELAAQTSAEKTNKKPQSKASTPASDKEVNDIVKSKKK